MPRTTLARRATTVALFAFGKEKVMAIERSFGIALEGGFRRELVNALSDLDGLAHLLSPEGGAAR